MKDVEKQDDTRLNSSSELMKFLNEEYESSNRFSITQELLVI
ncbi:MAG: hypothetical protein ACTSQZ_08720 [Candidatus Thorarchaeota archaeon]